jgi:tetratricopeptide (TPR) repeat protein
MEKELTSMRSAHVGSGRLLEHHAPRQLAFYRELQGGSPSPKLPPALLAATATPLGQLRQQPGRQQSSPRHWRRDLVAPAELQLQAGMEAMQRNRWPEALDHFRQASAADPADPYALVFLGQALERQGNPALAQRAFERAASLDPLCSRPARALAGLHRRCASRWAAAAAALNPLAPLAAGQPPTPR